MPRAVAPVAFAVLMLLDLAFGVGPAVTGSFSDVTPDQPYSGAIVDLADRGIINGYLDGSFRPDAPVLRQQFAKMLVSTVGLAVSEADTCQFVDVPLGGPDSLYPDNYIAVAASRGAILGTAPGLFAPRGNLTRAQMVSMIVRAIDSLSGGALPMPSGGGMGTWARFDPRHDANARWAESEGLLAGLPLEILSPGGIATRGEVAQVLHNFSHDTRYYGAKGDGVTDDNAAIQAAVDDAARAGGTVTFGGGTFVVSSGVGLRSGIGVAGVPGQTILFMPAQPSAVAFLHGQSLSNVRIEGLTFRAKSYNDNVSGVMMYGAADCRLSDLRFENLTYGVKLGSGNGTVASGWVVEDIVTRNSAMSLYASHIVDSSFARLDLQGAGLAVDRYSHDIYLEQETRRVTFDGLTLTRGSGYAINLYTGSGGSSSDVTFNNLTLDAREGRWALHVGDRWTNVRFINITMLATTDDVVRMAGPQDITFDGFTASGGVALVGTFGDTDYAERITFKNGTYTGAVLARVPYRINNLVFQNVTLPGSTTTTTVPPTTTTTVPPSTTKTIH